MAADRWIHCNLCLPETDWRVKPEWTADQAMAWFHNEHLKVHIADVMKGLVALLGFATPHCRPCRANNALHRTDHRPCFEVDCYCACSRPTTTTTERTAHADG